MIIREGISSPSFGSHNLAKRVSF